MELKKFIEDFTGQFDETDPSLITEKTKFHDLEEWGSLTSMGLIAMVRTEYGKAITGAEIRQCETVDDLFRLVKSK